MLIIDCCCTSIDVIRSAVGRRLTVVAAAVTRGAGIGAPN